MSVNARDAAELPTGDFVDERFVDAVDLEESFVDAVAVDKVVTTVEAFVGAFSLPFIEQESVK